MACIRKSIWSGMLANRPISVSSWRRVWQQRWVSPSNTAILVEVEPGLITRIRQWFSVMGAPPEHSSIYSILQQGWDYSKKTPEVQYFFNEHP